MEATAIRIGVLIGVHISDQLSYSTINQIESGSNHREQHWLSQ
jgi:hypothetical protein